MKLAAALVLASIATSAHGQAPRAWVVETPKDADAWLRYGAPGERDQPLAFTCVRKSGQVQLGAVVGKTIDRPVPASVTLTSEAAGATLRGRVKPLPYGALAGAEFSTRAPVAAAFRKTGLISVSVLGETVVPPPAPKGAVRKFLSACK